MTYDLYASYENGVLCVSDENETVLFNSLLTVDNRKEAEEIFEDKECLVLYETTRNILGDVVRTFIPSESLISEIDIFIEQAKFTCRVDIELDEDDFYIPLPADYIKYNDVEVYEDSEYEDGEEVFYVLSLTLDDIYKMLFGEDCDFSIPKSVIISRCSQKLNKSIGKDSLKQEIHRWIIEKVKLSGEKDSSNG